VLSSCVSSASINCICFSKSPVGEPPVDQRERSYWKRSWCAVPFPAFTSKLDSICALPMIAAEALAEYSCA
jgi:hypothetical protein